MRSIWKGSISFGLVHIPIQLYTATSEKQVRFNQLHRVCRTPIRYVRHCPTCDIPVEPEHIVKGFEYEPDRYVLIEPEDLETLPLPTLRTIDILHFVDLDEVDPIYFGKTYYIEPQERADKAYGLLYQAMRDAGKVAIAKVALRSKESLATVRIYRHVLALELMYYPDEIRSVDSLRGMREAPQPREAEMLMARQLIESLSVPIQPEQYEDAYREALLARIQQKAGEDRGLVSPDRPVGAEVESLLAALEASLAAAQRGTAQQESQSNVPEPTPVR